MGDDLKLGDIVTLNSGGPGMTITAMRDKESVSVSFWQSDSSIWSIGHNNKSLISREFHVHCLIKVEDKEMEEK